MSLSRLLADALVLVHLSFVVFVVLGGLLSLRWRWAAALHLPAALWGALIEFQGWVCPLTPLENRLRRAAGQEGYSGGFVEHYVLPVLYPSGLTTETQLVLGALVVVVNVTVYGWVYRRWRGGRT